jgi:hypothetical protein
MSISKTILNANLNIAQILTVYQREVDTCKYGYMGTLEITYHNREVIEIDHLNQTFSIYNPLEDIFTTYYWWSGSQVWKDYSK